MNTQKKHMFNWILVRVGSKMSKCTCKIPKWHSIFLFYIYFTKYFYFSNLAWRNVNHFCPFSPWAKKSFYHLFFKMQKISKVQGISCSSNFRNAFLPRSFSENRQRVPPLFLFDFYQINAKKYLRRFGLGSVRFRWFFQVRFRPNPKIMGSVVHYVKDIRAHLWTRASAF